MQVYSGKWYGIVRRFSGSDFVLANGESGWPLLFSERIKANNWLKRNHREGFKVVAVKITAAVEDKILSRMKTT